MGYSEGATPPSEVAIDSQILAAIFISIKGSDNSGIAFEIRSIKRNGKGLVLSPVQWENCHKIAKEKIQAIFSDFSDEQLIEHFRKMQKIIMQRRYVSQIKRKIYAMNVLKDIGTEFVFIHIGFSKPEYFRQWLKGKPTLIERCEVDVY